MKNKKADNFTPGPWKVDSDGADVWVMKDHSGGQGIAAIFDVNGIAEMTANAALIAAADKEAARVFPCLVEEEYADATEQTILGED